MHVLYAQLSLSTRWGYDCKYTILRHSTLGAKMVVYLAYHLKKNCIDKIKLQDRRRIDYRFRGHFSADVVNIVYGGFQVYIL